MQSTGPTSEDGITFSTHPIAVLNTLLNANGICGDGNSMAIMLDHRSAAVYERQEILTTSQYFNNTSIMNLFHKT